MARIKPQAPLQQSKKKKGPSRIGAATVILYSLTIVILEENGIDLAKMKVLTRKMKELGIDSNLCKPRQYNHLICPMCKGGDSVEKSLSLFINANGNLALWTCFQAKCGWRGNTGYQTYVNGKSMSERISHILEVKQTREITEKSLDLEPTCSEVAVVRHA
ncbi:hypothetical protein LOK49_LG10G02226 [Camellia lanceoleosa]|uniref:Uncharacterized protein n=1 Tax=Camellia lanceoleosa TaxID=1840588 RepID=A0ACC0G5X2_9ERIC|nr:hypothetical protein LOK49_LG10G02226 [Camellia lanceoleosa]